MEKLIKNTIFLIYSFNKRFFSCKTVYTIKFVVGKTLILSMYAKIVLWIISKIFNKIFAPPILGVVFTPSTSTIADKKKYESNIFLKTTFMPNFIKINDSGFGVLSDRKNMKWKTTDKLLFRNNQSANVCHSGDVSTLWKNIKFIWNIIKYPKCHYKPNTITIKLFIAISFNMKWFVFYENIGDSRQ